MRLRVAFYSSALERPPDSPSSPHQPLRRLDLHFGFGRIVVDCPKPDLGIGELLPQSGGSEGVAVPHRSLSGEFCGLGIELRRLSLKLTFLELKLHSKVLAFRFEICARLIAAVEFLLVLAAYFRELSHLSGTELLSLGHYPKVEILGADMCA